MREGEGFFKQALSDRASPLIEDTLALYRWDGRRWVREASSVVHPEANTVTTALDRFGLWAVLGKTRRMLLPVVVKDPPPVPAWGADDPFDALPPE